MKVVPAIFLISLLVFFGSCGPEGPFSENEMTRQDSLEKYQMIAKVNGEDWRVCRKGSLPVLSGYDNGNFVSVSGTDMCNEVLGQSDIYIRLYDPIQKGIYALTDYHSGSFTGIYKGTAGLSLTSHTNLVQVGEVEITYYDGTTISGNFWFDAKFSENDEVVQIRNGSFYDVLIRN